MLLFVSKTTPAAFETAAALAEHRSADGALAAVKDYVDRKRRRGASLAPLHEGAGAEITEKGAWRMAMPQLDPEDGAPPAVNVLRLASVKDGPRLKALLEEDPERIEYVHHPAIRYPMMAVPKGSFPHQQGLRACGFPDVWDTMDTGPDPGPIAVIDEGIAGGHKEVKGRIAKLVLPRRRAPSPSNHAAAVASIIAAHRGDRDDLGMAGCCSASLHVYSVWTFDGRFDALGYYRALRAVAKSAGPVLNLSMGGPEPDPTEEWHIRYCLSRGVVVVAAMGNEGVKSPLIYPAAYEGVVGVGATSASDTPLPMSSRGKHICLSAPGEHIQAASRGHGYIQPSGTSFASAFVTAAVWLARRKQPSLTTDQVVELLRASVEPSTVPNGGHSPDVGHGRLHMPTLLAELDKRSAPQPVA